MNEREKKNLYRYRYSQEWDDGVLIDRRSIQGGPNEEMGAGTFQCENQSISPLSPSSSPPSPGIKRELVFFPRE